MSILIGGAINEWRISLEACLQLQELSFSKWCNNINNWLNQQHYHLCKTLIG